MSSSTKPETEIRWCPMDRVADLQRFIDEHWRKGHILARDRALVEWQHRRDEATLSFLLAETRGRIDGVLGIIPADWNYYGQRLKAHWLALWCARSGAASGTGLRLMGRAMSGVQVVGVLGINPRAVPLFEGLKFAQIRSVPRYVCQFDGPREDRRPQAGASARPGTQGINVMPREDLGGWELFWQSQLAPLCTGTWKDADWLRWRYSQHPTFDYQTDFFADDEGKIQACCVYRIAELEPGWRMMRIVELMGIGDAALVAAEHLCRTAMQWECSYADFYCTSSRFAAPLVACGFCREERVAAQLPALLSPVTTGRTTLNGAIYCTHELFDSSGRLLDEDLYVTRGDGDQDRPN